MHAGAKLLFGGKELQGHTIPKKYGAIEPTAVFVPLKEIVKSDDSFKLATTEIFGPLQVSLQMHGASQPAGHTSVICAIFTNHRQHCAQRAKYFELVSHKSIRLNPIMR